MGKRQDIVSAAEQLFYQQGFGLTPFADLASAVGISRGNFYHHFKTKDDILAEVVELRLEKSRAMIAGWERQSDDPADRICSYIQILLANQDPIENFGCPLGSFANEMAKAQHPMQAGARQLFDLFHVWLTQEFTRMAADRPEYLAMRVLQFSQGAATISNTYRNREFIGEEVARMCAWARSQDRRGNLKG